VEYIKEFRCDSSIRPIFKLSNLARKYGARLQQLGETVSSRTNSTKLKERLLSHIPDLKAETKGNAVWLGFDKHVGNALSTACQFDADMEALNLSRAAQIVRRDLLKMNNTFCGTFERDYQLKSVPKSLLALVHMILEGPSIDDQSHLSVGKAALSIAQLLTFNSVKHARKKVVGVKTRHSVSQETPLPLYVAMKVHAETRNRDLIDHMFSLGLCVSYDRLLTVSAGLGN
jgi:hypothetical protein